MDCEASNLVVTITICTLENGNVHLHLAQAHFFLAIVPFFYETWIIPYIDSTVDIVKPVTFLLYIGSRHCGIWIIPYVQR